MSQEGFVNCYANSQNSDHKLLFSRHGATGRDMEILTDTVRHNMHGRCCIYAERK
jgi:hypothetical protein